MLWRFLSGSKQVKWGPFTATSGVVLRYYLNLTTNFLDRNVAADISDLLEAHVAGVIRKLQADGTECEACLGMEVAGGILVSQLAASRSQLVPLSVQYCYMRKERKTTGTAQLLEGPQALTRRTPESPPLSAIWLDDTLSTGSSLLHAVVQLWDQFRIRVVAAVYLVDRAEDRCLLPKQSQYLADKALSGVWISAVFSLQEIDVHLQDAGGPTAVPPSSRRL